VLVVDDNELNTTYIATVLRNHPFEVEIASDGPAALAAIARRRPDVILLDIMMPGMSGLEVLDRLRRENHEPQIPVILITAKVHDSTLLEGYESGADYFIPKPFTPRQLLYGLGLTLEMHLLD
jgi:CheY-like chemotaxis protein